MNFSDIDKDVQQDSALMGSLELSDDDLSKIAGGRGTRGCKYYVFPPEYIVGTPPKKQRLGGGLNLGFNWLG